MYIRKINYQNVGPLTKIDIDLPFNKDKPMPLIIVGENGSGKSLMLSSIVDAMYEIGGHAFENVTKSKVNGHYFYKLSSTKEIQLGKKYSSSYILFEFEGVNLEYLSKNGNISFVDWMKETGITTKGLKWEKENDNKKLITQGKEICQKLFVDSICCYFSPNRFSKPFWLSDNYYEVEKKEFNYSLHEKFANYLYNPITVENSYVDNISWLLDIICDSRIDVNIITSVNNQTNEKKDIFSFPSYVNQNNVKLLKIARQNVEMILNKILNKEVFLRANYRGNGLERVYLADKDNQIVLASLNLLSTGQMALFNIFLNIIRYADNIDINKSIHLADIKGIVVIDEIDLHLHSDMQFKVLPELIKLFPQVQFIITTHAPLFILGMEKFYGKGNYVIREMPNNDKIEPEEFSQFVSAFEMLKDTKQFRNEISAVKQQDGSKALIITEGPSDWIHIKNAIKKLKSSNNIDKQLKERINNLSVEFLEFYPKNSNKRVQLKLQMGDGALISMCEQFSKIQQNRKYIFIADHDKDDTIKKLDDDKQQFKSWGNNVFSFCIPIPKNRNQKDICIELYYTDNDLKRIKECDDGIRRRIYLSNEFDSNGISTELNLKCENKELCNSREKINILDGSKHKKIYIHNSDLVPENEKSRITEQTNFGLSKIDFAECIYNDIDGFKDVDCQNFIDILKKIIMIIDN